MMSTQCIFASSKYYKQAYASAQSISQPLGYSFLSQKQSNPQQRIQKGTLIKKNLFDKPLFKQLSNKRTLKSKIAEHLLAEDRKKFTYLSAHPMSILTKTKPEINQQLAQIYAPSLSQQTKNTIDFASSIHSINKQTFFNISDFALSKYFIFYDGSNLKNLLHVINLLERQFLEYDMHSFTTRKFDQLDKNDKNECKKSMNSIQSLQFDHKDINNKDKIDEYISKIKRKANQMDLMNEGLQFFIGDSVAKVRSYDILKEETQNFEYLQFYLYMLCNGILTDGQNAIIKVRGTIRNKTTDFLYMYKLIFNKISLVKPAFSNFLSSEKYLICQGFINENAEQLRTFLSDNFDLLRIYGQQRLLINPQMIFRQQVHGDNTKNFNDSLITRGLKQVLDLYLKNSNLEIYPPRTALIQKIQSFEDPEIFNSIIQEVQRTIPSEDEIKNQQGQTKQGLSEIYNKGEKNKVAGENGQTQQKQAGLDIFDFMRLKDQTVPVVKVQKKQQKIKVDQEQQMLKKLNEKFQQQQRIRLQKKKQKKERQKKQKKERDQDPYNNYNSHFEYSEF